MKMKRFCSMLLALTMLFSAMQLSVPVLADVIVFPDSVFFEENMELCTRVERYFTADGPDGKVTVYESPESAQVFGIVDNGTTLHISWSYIDEAGNQWACYENWEEHYCGWIPMAYLRLVYDAISFREEHGHEVLLEGGTLSDVYSRETARFHEYPGSPNYEEMLLTEWNGGRGANTYSQVYVDSNGDKWVMVDKEFYIFDDAWVNLNVDRPPQPEQKNPETQQTESVPQETEEIKPVPTKPDTPLIAAISVSVVALVAVTWLLLLAIKKKK